MPADALPPPPADLGLVVVIPAHDEPDLDQTLSDLAAAEPPDVAVEVLVVLNSRRDDPPARRAACAEDLRRVRALAPALARPWLSIHAVDALGRAEGGVGRARRLGMDLGAARLAAVGRGGAPLWSLDADCRVEASAARLLLAHFAAAPRCPGVSIHAEHPLDGPLPEACYEGVARFELGLRLHAQGVRRAGLPHGFITLGGAFAVRASVYRAQGGMNPREAGEDFYFLHKIIPLGGFAELATTTVRPASRISRRTPFGTGRAVEAATQGDPSTHGAPHPALWDTLGRYTAGLPALYRASPAETAAWCAALPPPLPAFLAADAFEAAAAEARDHSASAASFLARITRFMGGLRTLRLANLHRTQPGGEVPLLDATHALYPSTPAGADLRAALIHVRGIDRARALESGPAVG